MRLPGPRIRHLLTAALILPGTAALACTDPPERAEYVIHHETYGNVGRHVVTFSCEGDDLIVETEIEGEVKVLMVPLFKRDGTYREVWRGDRLIAFDSRTEDNGEVYEVSARVDGEHTIINGRRGRIEAPATIVPNHPWNRKVVERTLLFDTQRGRLQKVQVTPAGTETITVAGRPVAAQKYLVTGDIQRQLWYDDAGNWLQSRLEHDGAKVTLDPRVDAGPRGLVSAIHLGQSRGGTLAEFAMAPRAWLLAVLLVLSADARALAAPASYRYRIHHQIFGDIGEHRMTVRREGGSLVVEHTAELAVEILGLTAFHRRTRFREVWRDDRLIAFEGLVEDNGEPFPVSARAEGDRLVVDGSAGRIEAPAATAPSEPSLERAIRREWFFDSKTGELLNATVTPAGREPLKVGQEVVDAIKYEVTGDLAQHLWFDASGAWVQWRLWRQGAAITLLRD